uniref:Uncharacterized protein n=1 Tax=Hucho hucho TaxID=62062 RepID=A0A4W5KAD2_9TELE
MQLQSRFGADDRFQMDCRFIDSDEDEPEKELSQPERECELVEEKKKNLDILNNLLNVNVQPSDPNKPPAKGKTFRSVATHWSSCHCVRTVSEMVHCSLI